MSGKSIGFVGSAMTLVASLSQPFSPSRIVLALFTIISGRSFDIGFAKVDSIAQIPPLTLLLIDDANVFLTFCRFSSSFARAFSRFSRAFLSAGLSFLSLFFCFSLFSSFSISWICPSSFSCGWSCWSCSSCWNRRRNSIFQTLALMLQPKMLPPTNFQALQPDCFFF